MQGMSNTNSNQTQNTRQSTIDVPVRILVPSESVGAIIGKGGQTIRQLTQQTRAKVDVYRGDPMAPSNTLQEKVITIRGQPENCINACREILKVMKTDAESKGKPIDIPLKVLAHNDYIGRIIGKQGNIINTIKKETETSVTVSSINDMSMNVERVITVKGELENMIKALEIIHAKVKSAFENDTKTYGAQAIMMGGIPPLPLAPPAFAAASAAAAAFNAAPPNSAARFAAAAAVAAAAAQHGLPPHQVGGGTSNASGGGAQSGHHSGSNASIQAGSGQAPSQQSGGGVGGGSGGPGGIATSYGNFYPPNAAIYHQHQMAGQGPSSHAPNQASAANAGGVYSPAAALLPQSQQQSLGVNAGGQAGLEGGPEPETVYLYIPNVAVGAIIGTKGSYIKNIIKLSGASVKITPLSPEESKTAVERQVVIVGTPDSQWKAQYYVYEKIRQERFATDDNVKLKAEIQVPSHIVGRIIGKSGKNVRELQRSTGATIKLPEDITSLNQQGSASSNNVAGAATQATSSDGNASASSEQTGGNEQQQNQQQQQPPSGNESNEAAATPATTTTTTTATTAASPTEGQTDAQSSSSSSGAGEQKSGAEASSVSPNGNQNGGQLNSSVSSNGFVTVRIFGTFQASQCAQRRILSLVNQSVRGGGPQSLMGNHQITPITPIPLINHYHHRDYSHSQPHSNQRTNGGAPYNRRNRQQQNNNHQQHKEHQQQHQGNQQQQQQQQNGTASNNGATSSGSQVAANLNNSVGEQSQSGQTNAAAAAAQSPSVSSSSSSQPIVAAVSS